MDEKTKKQLLDAVRASALRLSVAKDERRVAVQAALEAGIARQEIADALGMHRNSVYTIIRES